MDRGGIKRINFGDMDGIYRVSDEGRVAFSLVVAGDDSVNLEKCNVDSLVQISCTGDSSVAGFAAGETRHNSGMTQSLRYDYQRELSEGKRKTVIMHLKNDDGVEVSHVVTYIEGARSLIVYTVVTNNSDEELMLEKVSSFSMSGITPYCEGEATGHLYLHRFRSRWSEEGRHEERAIEELLLEPSWARFAVRCEKFGAIGSMPIRGYFPVALIEDRAAGVFWGVTNACSSSWQIETVRIDEGLSITGGLADYEYGHWRKLLKKGESFTTPESFVSVGRCDFDTICDRLVEVQKDRLLKSQRAQSLPAIFNEYCTTWGEPSEENITRILEVVSGSDFEYFVIDAGWYADSVKGWQDNMGDWNVAPDLFPNGIKPVVKRINDAGMKAGIWFELEVVGKDADALSQESQLLTRDGKIIISGTRRFWDMRSEWVNDYLSEKVIDFLNENGFKYIKIDYNETIGIGCDGAESYGEALRECVEATKNFYKKIRECVPGIAIEVCSSGGHRLEPSFMQTADYLSFSDAHEEREIPVIAADLHRLILPSKSQIWAVLRKDDSLARIAYSVCAGMYGVLCISGDVFNLSKEQWSLALEGVSFYKKASPVIANGFTKRFGPFQKSNRALKEYQASVRYGENGQALVIVHSFEHDGNLNISIPLNDDYEIEDKYETGNHDITIAGRNINIRFDKAFDAVAVLITPN